MNECLGCVFQSSLAPIVFYPWEEALLVGSATRLLVMPLMCKLAATASVDFTSVQTVRHLCLSIYHST